MGNLRPLTGAQLGQWFAQAIDPDNPIYDTSQVVDLRGDLDVDRLVHAIIATVRKSEVLSIRFVETPEGPRQEIGGAAPIDVAIVDLSHDPDPEAAARRWIADTRSRHHTLTTGPLVAQAILILGPQRHWWYQQIHHTLVDGYGTALLTKRVSGRVSASNAAETLPETLSLASVLDEDAAYEASPRAERDRAFWMEYWADAPEAASLSSRTCLTSHTWHRWRQPVGAALRQGLAERAAAADVAWPDIVALLTAAFIARHTGQQEVAIGLPVMNRLGTPAARVPAMVMNVLPVRVAIDEDMRLDDWLTTAAAAIKKARRHGRYRSERLRRDLGRVSHDQRLFGPLVNVLPFDFNVTFEGLDASIEALSAGAVDDLTFTIRGDIANDAVVFELDSNPACYSEEETTAIGERWAHFLLHAITAERLSDVPTLTPAEERRWVHEVNATAHPVEDTTLIALIERQFAARAASPALRFDGRTMTYAELDDASRTLAIRLLASGVQRGDRVAVALHRSFELVISLIAILRAGAAYVPIDPDEPVARIDTMFATAEPRAVITSAALADVFRDKVTTLVADSSANAGTEPVDLDAAAPEPDDLAYVIFTSGSTGAPKGVAIEHRAIVNRVEWMREHYGFIPEDRILQKTPATFDVSVWEFFLPLVTGATLVIAPTDAHRDPAWMVRLIRDENISTVHFVPSILSAVLAEPTARGLSLERVFTSGEELPAATRDRFNATITAELFNLYGPTEAAVDVTHWPAVDSDFSEPVPIGFPVWNTRVYVLDGRMRPVPPGATGDLYLAGVQLARGYIGQPDLTVERFVYAPWDPSERLYRTGDRARWRPDGALEFHGRADFQVKIRGVRIELGEIEAALSAAPGVRDRVVIAREDRPGDKRLVAYLTLDRPDVSIATIDESVRSRVPSAFVPSAYVVLDALPVTRHGKVDLRQLPAPATGAHPTAGVRSSTEREVAHLFADALGVPADELGSDSDFFRLGGHSLTAATLTMAIRERWPIECGIGAVFEHSTIALLAKLIDQRRDGARITAPDGLAPLVVLEPGADTDRPPLFCIHPAGGIAWCYTGLARAISPARTVYGLQAPGLDLTAPLPASLDTLAAQYVDTIRRVRPDGPYHLLGWSVGGIIAQAMAAQLTASGAEVGVVALLDAYPCDRWRGQAPPSEDAALGAVMQMAGFNRDEARVHVLTRQTVIDFLKQSSHPLSHLSEDTLGGIIRVVSHNSQLVRRHEHTRLDRELLHFRAALDHQDTGLDPHEWDPYAAQVTVIDVPSMHAHLTRPAVLPYIAPILSAHLLASEQRS